MSKQAPRPNLSIELTRNEALMLAELTEKASAPGAAARTLADLYDKAAGAKAYFEGADAPAADPAD